MESKLINGDCFLYMRDIPSGSVNLIVTDPPYAIPFDKGGGSSKGALAIQRLLQKDMGGNLKDGYDIAALASEIDRLQGGNINAYFFCNKLQIPEYFRVYAGMYECKFDVLCWHKHNVPPMYSRKYLSDTEYILWFHKGRGGVCPQCYEDAKTYWVQKMNQQDKKRLAHPTIKPMNIISTLIRNTSKEGDTILDPFMGSGTTGVACHMLGRKFIGIEIDREYFGIAEKRIRQADIEPLSLFPYD